MLSIFILISLFVTIYSTPRYHLHPNVFMRNGVSKILPLIIAMQPISELSVANSYSSSNSLLLSDSVTTTVSPNVISSIENIERVYKSIRYVEEDIANKGNLNILLYVIPFIFL